MTILDKVRSISRNRAQQGGEEETSRGRDAQAVHHPSHLNPAHSDAPHDSVHLSTHDASPHPSHKNGTEAYILSGRGGLGNRSESRGRTSANVQMGTDDESVSDLLAARSRSRSQSRSRGLESRGRGGAGNVGAPSTLDKAAKDKLEEEDFAVAEGYEKKHHNDFVASGRGGAGNIGHSRGS